MGQRVLGRTGRKVSVVGLGTWQLGEGWGDVREEDAFAVLDASVAEGVTFFDTADEYGDGRSEQLIGGYLRERPDAGVFVATKMGRALEQLPANYTLDLVQLHCPPTPVLSPSAVVGRARAAKASNVGRHPGCVVLRGVV